ncbi:MAG TPA: hypothetical protein DCQ31_15965 [Bacteroidales bacterium]|nr:hypothetical protein [Bacteroidales bacterium]
MKNNCPLCNSEQLNLVGNPVHLPVFQNKVYNTEREAKNANTGIFSLTLCEKCGFIFNRTFDQNLMNYNTDYHNEQEFSAVFDLHLNQVQSIISKHTNKNSKLIEVGCGKGHFLSKLKKEGFSITGFDPAYEGTDNAIIKDYFSEKYSNIDAELIILRHTLEHIEFPLQFLQNIAKANNFKGKIYIEVPAFEWIANNRAVWDLFYEHCNYFTKNTLYNLFTKSEHGFLFGEQYQYLVADLESIKTLIEPSAEIRRFNLDFTFSAINQEIKDLIRFTNTIIWGGSSKGVTFLNILGQLSQNIKTVIDINPKKSGKYIAVTGHKIILPENFDFTKTETVLVMNGNYLPEINELIEKHNLKIISIDQHSSDCRNAISVHQKELTERINNNVGNKSLQQSKNDFLKETIQAKYSYNFSWLGIPIIQYPQDIVAMQELIWEIKPDLIIETGIAHGGSLIFYASMLELLNKGEIVGIDIDIRAHNRMIIEKHPMYKRITMIEGSSIAPETAEKVFEKAKNKQTIMVVLDSNHTHEHVLLELELYANLVTPQSYLVVFDTIVEDLADLGVEFPNRPWRKGNNPKTAVHEFLKNNSDFEIDYSIQNKLLITVAPDGYLKRVK